MTAAICWFRRDLRAADNTALAAAARDADTVIPVFILDDAYLRSGVGPSRFVFLRESLEDLGATLARLGSRLALLPGPAHEALPRLLAETGATAVYANEEIGPYPAERDRRARAAVERFGAKFRLFSDCLAVDPRAIETDEGRPYTIFTPFARKWRQADSPDPSPPPPRLESHSVTGVPIASVEAWRGRSRRPDAPRGGESAADEDWNRVLAGPIRRYRSRRDFPAETGTSRLSAALHFGTISPRRLLADARTTWRESSPGERLEIESFVTELAWREFYANVLFHFPRVAGGSFPAEFDDLEWDEPGEKFERWKQGRTGFPFVDAAMRQLAAENWMHNRARMVVASFLTKDLHVSWREGERWFEHELADADLASNNGGWQWAAGTGTDAAPYFRVFNPVVQSKRFDPRGDYIRRYVPELASVPAPEIHEPRDPIVDHAREKAETLKRYRRVAGRRS